MDASGDGRRTVPNRTPRDPESALVSRLRGELEALGPIERRMLGHYREYGPTTPLDAHAAAGGSGDRAAAYAANRSLRTRGLVAHVGRGHHDYALPSLVAAEATDPFDPKNSLPSADRDRLVGAIESTLWSDAERHATGIARDARQRSSTGVPTTPAVAPWPEN